jgi:flagellar export protein FliJ
VSACRDRLGSVLRIRRLQEEAQRGRLLLAQAEVTSAGAVVARRQEAYAGLAPQSDDRAGAFLAERSYRTARAAAILVAQGEQQAADERAVVAKHAWTEAAREVDGVERLVERARVARFAEQLRVEQEQIDEASMARRVIR